MRSGHSNKWSESVTFTRLDWTWVWGALIKAAEEVPDDDASDKLDDLADELSEELELTDLDLMEVEMMLRDDREP